MLCSPTVITPDLRAKVTQLCSRHPAVEAVYLFGSQADGSAGPHSDFDFGVLCARGTSPEECGNIQADLCGQLCLALRTNAVDVVVINLVKSAELKYAIIQDGELLFSRVQNLDDFELRVRHEYYDHMAGLRRAGFL